MIKNPFMVFSEEQIAGMSFRELAERAIIKAAAGRRGAAQKILDHDFHEKINLERLKIEQEAQEARALVKEAFEAIDSDM